MRLASRTGNMEFLCAIMYAKESRLLSKSQLQLLKSLKHYEELLSVLSGTVFHRFVAENKDLSESVSFLERGAGIEVRNFFKIEPDLMLLSVLDKVSEAYKALAFVENGTIDRERVFLCGLTAEELLNPQSLALPLDSAARDVLMIFRESMGVLEDPFSIDLKMYILKKKARKMLAERFGDDVKTLIMNMDFVSDVFNALGWVRFKLVDLELIFEHRIDEQLDEGIRNAIQKYRKDGDFESFVERISSKGNYRVLRDFFNGTENLEKLYDALKATYERLLISPAYSLLTPAYPIFFMHRFYGQVEEIKKAILNLEKSFEKKVKEVAASA